MRSGTAVLGFTVAAVLTAGTPSALDTTITYQGRLLDAGAPATGAYDLRFTLYDDEIAGAQVGPVLFEDDVSVSDGHFTVALDFGAGIFSGDVRWLEVAVRPGSDTGGYTVLDPRQRITPSPYALHSGSVSWGDVAGKPAGFADGVDDTAPSGAVMFFDLPSCPGGWSELAAADGRAIVGISSTKTHGGTVGGALSNLENRQHVHSVNPPSVSSSSTGNHAHNTNLPSYGTSPDSHTHDVNIASLSSGLGGSHNHEWAHYSNTDWYTFSSNGNSWRFVDWGNGMDAAGADHYPISVNGLGTLYYYTNIHGGHYHTVNPPSTASTPDSHSHVIDHPSVASDSSGSHTHTVDVINHLSSFEPTSDVMPYIQLLVCVKD